MTIKKLKTSQTVKAAPAPRGDVGEAASAAVPATGGATIADRFKLDLPDPNAKKGGSVSKKAAAVALVVGLLSLAVAGFLTFVLYQHWDFLCNQTA